jgi:hypothetical protein
LGLFLSRLGSVFAGGVGSCMGQPQLVLEKGAGTSRRGSALKAFSASLLNRQRCTGPCWPGDAGMLACGILPGLQGSSACGPTDPSGLLSLSGSASAGMASGEQNTSSNTLHSPCVEVSSLPAPRKGLQTRCRCNPSP